MTDAQSRILGQIRDSDQVIHVGCGSGEFLREYRNRFPVTQEKRHTCYGIDASLESINACLKDILEFTGHPIVFPDETPFQLFRQFDIVVAQDTDQYPEQEKALLALAKLLKDKESVCFISFPDDILLLLDVDDLAKQLYRYFDSVAIHFLENDRRLLAVCTEVKDLSTRELEVGVWGR